MTPLQSTSNHKPRLVLFLSTFPQPSETFIVSKFLGLLERGWDVLILCNQRDMEIWQQFPNLLANPEAKKRVHAAWPHQPHWLAGLFWFPALLWCLYRAPRSTLRYFISGWGRFGMGISKQFYLDAPLIHLRPDIVHFEFGSLVVGRTHLKELLDVKLSVSFRGYDLNYIGLDQPNYYQQVWDTVNKVHFLGHDLWQRAQKRGLPKDLPHVLIPPAIELINFPKSISYHTGKLGTHECPLQILSVGRLHWKKGYEFNLQAVKHLIDQGLNCDYQIIGDGNYKAALYYACQQFGLEKVVKFCGSLPHAQVIEKFRWADVFLHGAISEGFCNAVLEAQAMGVPVVCTDADGLPENIRDRVTGFVVPQRDAAALAEKLALLARDGKLRSNMAKAGRKRVETHFQMEDQLNAFEQFYEQL